MIYAIITEEIKLWAAQSTYYITWVIIGILGVKFVVNFLLRKIFMRSRFHPNSVLFLFAMSTTMIGTPMRLLCNYLLDSGNAIAAVLLLAGMEVLLRVGVILKVCLTVKFKLRRITDKSDKSLSMKKFIQWKSKRLSVLEAENYAEMLAEYMAIGFSVGIYAATTRQITLPMISLSLIQILVELIVDGSCLKIEERIGIPIATVLQTPKGIRMVLCTNAVLGITVATILMYLATKNVFLELMNGQ